MALECPKESEGHNLLMQAALASTGGSFPIGGGQETAEQEKQHLLGFSSGALTTLPGSSKWNAGTLSPWKQHSFYRTKVNSTGVR